jgi:hypothetical protein
LNVQNVASRSKEKATYVFISELIVTEELQLLNLGSNFN